MIPIMLLVVLSGAALSSQAAINGKLGAQIGVIQSSLLTFSVGAVVTALLILFFEPAHTATLLTVEKWQLTGALFGIVYMVVMVAAVPRIGVATATVATIFGQMCMSLVIDTQGWLGNTAIALDHWRLAAMLCVFLALVCVYLSNQQRELNNHD